MRECISVSSSSMQGCLLLPVLFLKVLVLLDLRMVLMVRGAPVVVVCDQRFVAGQTSKCAYTGVTSAGAEIRFMNDEEDDETVKATPVEVVENGVGVVEVEVPLLSQEYVLGMYDGKAKTYKSKTKVTVVSDEDGESLDDVASTRSLVQVETDKPLYAPGQKIKIRTLVADIENTALIKQKDGATVASVEVKDALERTIFKKADCAVDVFGVATAEVAIAKEQPPFGWWTVKAEVEIDDDGSKVVGETGFNVEEYVLPSFDVTFDASSMPLYVLASKSANEFSGKVESAYTYGKAVEGKAKVIIKRPSTSNYYYGGAVGGGVGGGDFVAVEEPAFKPPDEWDSSGSSSSSGSSGYPNEVSDILYESSWMTLYEGSATFVASISKSMLDQQWSRNLEAYAMVEEAATREIRNSTVLIVPIVREAFTQQTSMIYQSPALKPGLPMKHTIQLASDIPGAFSDTEDLGTLDFTLNINKMNSYSYSGDSNAQTISTRVSSSGALDIEFDAPANDLSCCASYEDETNHFYGSSQKCCLQGANVQLVKNAASRDVVKKILASASDDMSTTELDELVPYLSVYFARDTSSAKASVEVVFINASCESAEACQFTLASSRSDVAFAYAVVDAEGLGRGVLEAGTTTLSSTETEKTVTMTYDNIASTLSAAVSIAVWSLSGSVYSETYLAGTTSDVFLVPGTSVSVESESEIAFPYDITMNTNVSETNVVATGTDITFTIIGAPDGARSYILAIDEAVVIQSGGNTSALKATTFLSSVYDAKTNTLDASSNTWPCDATYNDNDIELDRVTIISTAEIASYCDPSSSSNGGFGVGMPEIAFGADMAMDDVAAGEESTTNKAATDVNSASSSPTMRTLFPETWLWESSDSGSFESTAPDSITTWSITAFTSHPTQGISILKTASKMTVFREFFISPKMPYTISRGETVEIVLAVFNYLKDQDMSVSVSAEDVTSGEAVQIGDSKTINVSKNSADSISFEISPTVLGSIKLRFSAIGTTTTSTDSESKEYTDAVEKSIVVNPEGVFKTTTVSKVFRRSAEDASETFTLNAFPNGLSANAIVDTYSSFITVVGDIMGPSIQNINKFVQIPMGCGEQNLLLLAPNVYIAEYLNSANKLTSALKTELSNNVIMGYSRELTYFHPSGGVSAFGPQSDKSASLWLTAFCSKVFASAKRSSESKILDGVSIDATVLKGAVDFMISTQGTNGAFSEPGVVLHSEMQSQSGDKFVLSSYAALSLIETVASIDDPSTKTSAQNSISSALEYVASSLDSVKSAAIAKEPSAVYSVIVSTYAFASACASLSTHCDLANSWITGVLELIGTSEVDGATSYGGVGASNSLKIESTAYVVLIYAKMSDSGNNFCYSALKFLLQNRNEFGGYGSTQDTVVALEALSTYAKLTREASSSGLLVLSFPNEVGAPSFTVDESSFDTFNTAQIAQRGTETFTNPSVSGDVSGSGVAVVSYTVRWYETVDLTEDTSDGLFTIDVTTRVVTTKISSTNRKKRRRLLTPNYSPTSMSSVEDAEMLQMKVCVKKTEITNGADGMALLRVPMFSGFQPVESSIANLDPERKYIKRVEVDPITSTLSLYIENFPLNSNDKLCATFDARRVAEVKNAQDVPGAQISMYYQQDKYRNAVMKSTDLEVGRFPEDDGGGGVKVEPDSAFGFRVTFILASVIALALFAMD